MGDRSSDILVVMNGVTKKNIGYVGLLSGLVVALICLFTPFARGTVVWYQLLAVIVSGGIIGYAFQNKAENSFAVSIFGMIFTLGATRVFSFVNESNPLLFTLALTIIGILFFFLFSKLFSLKLNNLLKYSIATFSFLIWFFFIPLIMLYIARITYVS